MDCRLYAQRQEIWKQGALIYPDTDRRWSYDELNRESNKFAAAMLRDGMKKGDVIMYQLLNCPEFVFVYVACHKLHTVNCPVSYRLSPGEIAQNIDDSKPRILLSTPRGKPRYLKP